MGTANPRRADLNSRSLRDATLVEHIRDVHTENYGVYGVRKMWEAEFWKHHPSREIIEIKANA
ncbi:hypothetical protein FRC0549_01697 [Corynebacterium diphtheriae]|nr:hypothetical protein FRC0549_01697 [Corynebacterium diphtheriae]